MNALINERELDLPTLASVLASDDKRDYAIPSSEMVTYFTGEGMKGTAIDMKLPNGRIEMPMTDYATAQLHSRLAPGLRSFAEHLRSNHMQDTYVRTMHDVLEKSDSTFRVRTLMNNNLLVRSARAVVSDRFKPIDDDIIFDAALPLIDSDRFHGIGGNKTDIRTVAKFIEREPSVVIQSGNQKREYHLGFILGNSEVGAATASFTMFMSDAFCLNGCIFHKDILANISYKHLGARIDVRHGLIEHSHIERVELHGIRNMIQKATHKAMSLEGRELITRALQDSADAKVERSDLPKFFEDLGKSVGLTKDEAKELPLYGYSDEMTKLGVQAAITALAQDKPYERRLALESIGGDVLMMNARNWKALAAA
jgi:hypothetical protein